MTKMIYTKNPHIRRSNWEDFIALISSMSDDEFEEGFEEESGESESEGDIHDLWGEGDDDDDDDDGDDDIIIGIPDFLKGAVAIVPGITPPPQIQTIQAPPMVAIQPTVAVYVQPMVAVQPAQPLVQPTVAVQPAQPVIPVQPVVVQDLPGGQPVSAEALISETQLFVSTPIESVMGLQEGNIENFLVKGNEEDEAAFQVRKQTTTIISSAGARPGGRPITLKAAVLIGYLWSNKLRGAVYEANVEAILAQTAREYGVAQ